MCPHTCPITHVRYAKLKSDFLPCSLPEKLNKSMVSREFLFIDLMEVTLKIPTIENQSIYLFGIVFTDQTFSIENQFYGRLKEKSI